MEIEDSDSSDEIKGTPWNSTKRRIISPNMSSGRMDTLIGSSSRKGKSPGKSQGSPRNSNGAPIAEPSREVARMALNWLDEIDHMRIKSDRLQGGISGEIKWRLRQVKED